jgi:group I intron endonuclease
MKPYGVIYLAKNRGNGLVYVGQTVNMSKRLSNYRQCIKEPRSYFEQSLAKRGMDGFEWTVIDSSATTPEGLDLLEKKWIAYYKSTDKQFGYNLTDGGWVNRNCTEECRAKMSEAKKRSCANPNFVHHYKGKKMPRHIVEANIAARKIIYGNSSAMKGKHHSDETKLALSIANAGTHSSPRTEFPPKAVLCVETGMIFPTITAAAKYCGRSVGTLCACVRGNQKVCAGYHWRYFALETPAASVESFGDLHFLAPHLASVPQGVCALSKMHLCA